ncbi:MAG: methyltransferase domain-containing protein [Thermoleophilia bacterium]|nr:methyltransferase domain-containing protein [Thermoleophilia bacterium]
MLRELLRRQTLASFDYQWRELPEADALLSDEWFRANVARIVADELLCLAPEWFRGRRVLDAGCGTGRWTVGLLELGSDVTAVDFSEHALEHLRENVRAHCSADELARLETRQVDLLRLPADLAAQRFDGVFSFGVLHHTGDTRAALGNVAALTGDDGVIFLYLYGKESVSRVDTVRLGAERLLLAPLPFRVKQRVVGVLRPGADVHHAFDLLSPTINTRHTFAEVRAWLEEAGFRDVARPIEHTELFVRGLRDPDAVAPFLLSPPQPPYWFERYA